ncbi:MAG: DUF429 domain-containing protein [Pseudonocardia sp.]
MALVDLVDGVGAGTAGAGTGTAGRRAGAPPADGRRSPTGHTARTRPPGDGHPTPTRHRAGTAPPIDSRRSPTGHVARTPPPDDDHPTPTGRRASSPPPRGAVHPAPSPAASAVHTAAPPLADAVRWAVLPTAADVLAATASCAAVGVDIPLGLPVGPERRACEVRARELLGTDRASVFFTPPRAVLEADGYPQACAVARRLTGRAISLQTFHIVPKIREWEALERPAHVVEVHPELSLRRLAPDVAFARKKSVRGAGQRIAALARWMDPAIALADLPDGARLDDVLDALAAAWSAARLALGCAEVLGHEDDDRGRPMRIVV